MSFDFCSKRTSRLLIIYDRLQNVYHEAAIKKTQVFFWGRFGEGEKTFQMKRGSEDHLPPVSMKFSLITSSGTHTHELADMRLPWRSHHKRILPTGAKGLG
jgi:hypothetical protein